MLFAPSPLTAAATSVYFSIADVRWSDATKLRKDLRLGEMPKVNALNPLIVSGVVNFFTNAVRADNN